MLFKQILIDKIIAEEKNETRRHAKDGETLEFDPDGKIIRIRQPTGRIKWEVGRDYAVQPGRGKSTYIHEGYPLRILILEIVAEPLLRIDEGAARKEGFANRSEFLSYWDKLYGEGSHWKNPNLYVLKFEKYAHQLPLWKAS